MMDIKRLAAPYLCPRLWIPLNPFDPPTRQSSILLSPCLDEDYFEGFNDETVAEPTATDKR